jgi:hypothetical protein
MSANNYATCPNCEKRCTDKIEEVKKLYNVLTVDDYNARLRKALEEDKNQRLYALREDWEIGVYNGAFRVDYTASCDKCGWTKRFKHEKQVP